MRTATLAIVVALWSAVAQAESLNVAFNLHSPESEWAPFIVEQQNVEIHTETGRTELFRYFWPWVAGGNERTNFWQGGIVGHVTFEFPLNFVAQNGTLSARTDTFYTSYDPNAFSRLSVSVDNSHWTAISGLNSDISSIVQGGSTIYVRDELYAEASPMFAQFLRSDVFDSTPTFVLNVTGSAMLIPEPATFVLGLVAALCLAFFKPRG
jgi:hypothetical protein